MPSVMIKISFTLRSSLSWWGAAEGVDVILVDCDLWWTNSWFSLFLPLPSDFHSAFADMV